MTPDYTTLAAQFGSAGLIVFFIVPALRGVQRSLDRLAKAHLLQLAESECLGEKLKKKAHDMAEEIRDSQKEDLS